MKLIRIPIKKEDLPKRRAPIKPSKRHRDATVYRRKLKHKKGK